MLTKTRKPRETSIFVSHGHTQQSPDSHGAADHHASTDPESPRPLSIPPEMCEPPSHSGRSEEPGLHVTMAETTGVPGTPAWGLSVPGDCVTHVGPAGLGGPPVRGTVSALPASPRLGLEARAAGRPRPASASLPRITVALHPHTHIYPLSICFAKQINSAPDSTRRNRTSFPRSHLPSWSSDIPCPGN